MLILTRKVGEEITIGESIVINVLEIRGSQVRLGISAPQAVAIHRGEIYERIRDENRRAGSVAISRAGVLSERLRALFPKRSLSKRSTDERRSRTDGEGARPPQLFVET